MDDAELANLEQVAVDAIDRRCIRHSDAPCIACKFSNTFRPEVVVQLIAEMRRVCDAMHRQGDHDCPIDEQRVVRLRLQGAESERVRCLRIIEGFRHDCNEPLRGCSPSCGDNELIDEIVKAIIES